MVAKIKVLGLKKEAYDEHYLVKAIKKYCDYEISEQPDFVFYGPWTKEHLKYNCVRIFYTIEPISPNFQECDYAIGFDCLDYQDRFFRLPFVEMNLTQNDLEKKREPVTREMLKQKRFCNFIYSNATAGNGALLRAAFCKKLMEYKHIDCPGMVLHNMDTDELDSRYSDNWQDTKLDFLGKYKFTIAFENKNLLGYSTEKISDPILARSIPIYYGNPKVVEMFNPEAFINCNDYDNDFDKIINKIIEIDNNDDLALSMLNAAPFNKKYTSDWENRLAGFIANIIRKGNVTFDKESNEKVSREYASDFVINKEFYRKAILDKISLYKKVYVYGDGKYASLINNIFEKEKIHVDAFCISTEKEIKTFGNSPLVVYDEIDKEEQETALFLIAVREGAVEAIAEKLQMDGYNNLLECTKELIDVLD